MKTAARVSALLALVAAARAEDASNPLAAVIGLCHELSAKVTADGEAEAKAYKEYFEWCDEVTQEKNFEIESATSQQEKLEAEIKELAAEIEEAESTISTLVGKIATNSDDLAAATKIRKKENKEFAANEKELIEVVDTLGRAIAVLEKELQGGSAAFAQISASKNLQNALQAMGTIIEAAGFSSTDKQKLVALVQARQDAEDEDEDAETSAPAGAAYESKSGGILDVLGDMQEKAESQLSELRKVEVTAKGNYDLLKQGLSDQLTNDNKDMEAMKANKAKAEESKATAEGDLSVTKDDLKNSKDGLASTQKGCMQVAADHESSITSRSEELKVIAQATKILEEVAAGGAAASASFLQVAKKAGVHSKVPTMIKALARKHHSAALAQLASRVTALAGSVTSSSDPFVKIRGMIETMIAKLEKEARESADEKAYCDAEMKKTKTSKGELDADIEKMSTSIDQAAAHSAELKQQVKDLQEELAAMAKEQDEAESIRSANHAVYVEQQKDLTMALSGIRKALDVLRDYYAKGDDAAALLQDETKFAALMQQPSPPAGHSKSGGSGGSIINILEVAESDTADNLAKVETEEADEVASFEKDTQQFKVAKAEKDQDVKYKTQQYMGLDKSITEISADRDTAGSELSAVEDYYTKLQDRCLGKADPYEERAKRREAEIEGLKEALSTLSSEAALVQKKGGKRHHMRGSLKADS
eukprot:TRINITY_DN8987_c1_g1_i1.p1 TRINITY_DN8987_c1_g1~~TRINITY_DN8987_c1_g1_i1.p1  ORF type:complete len:707 (-),score=311.13 TRINITY_DN8987_c1_g1_i1:196-2316(-)